MNESLEGEDRYERLDGFRGVRYIYIVYEMRINIRRKNRVKIQSLNTHMTTIHEIGTPFAFDSIQLDEPIGIQGGAYLSKIRMKKPLFQTPMLMIKSGIVVNDKKGYIDCMWDSRTNDGKTMTTFMESFETSLKTLIYEYREQWFDGDIDEEDINYFFQSAIKQYQGKYDVMRITLSRLSKTMLKDLSGETQSQEYGVLIYDEEERILDFDNLRENMAQQPAIFMVEPHCVKFTSTSFQIEYHLRQIMILKRPDESIRPVLQQCLILRKDHGESKKTLSPSSPQTIHEKKSHVDSHSPSPSLKETTITQEPQEPQNTQDNTVEASTPLKTGRQSPQLMDVELEFPEDEPTISLKHPNQVYYEMYNEARQRAQQARQEAMYAYLEAKHIQQTFKLTVDDDLEKDMNELSKQA